jgi:hypothetical protein
MTSCPLEGRYCIINLIINEIVVPTFKNINFEAFKLRVTLYQINTFLEIF